MTGYGADLIIIDDPVKGRSEAGSPVLRERLWNWFRTISRPASNPKARSSSYRPAGTKTTSPGVC
ncbi:MAG: hypothetical protein IPP63_15620 [Chloracidobacterium sp.]|nr:hypothetical protein [Chloracidobacterium sp.]